ASARLFDAGLRSRTSGRKSRTNGRISVRMIGVASLPRGRAALLALLSAGPSGLRSLVAGPRMRANVSTLPSVEVVWRSAPGRRSTARVMPPCSRANARKTCDDVSTSSVRSVLLPASSPLRTLRLWMRRRRFSRRSLTAVVKRARSRWVGSMRRSRSRRSVPRPVRPWPAPSTSSLSYSRDARDVADAHAGHADGLPLAGGDRLGGREARLERQRRRLPGEAQPLVGQDVRPAPGGCRDDPDDQEEVARVLADRPDHRPLATF